MAFFTWKDSFNIGIEEIDRQHREYLELLNEYYEVASHSTSATVGNDLAIRLKSYITKHFDYEVSLIKNSGYAEIDQQLIQHEYFQSRVSELEKALAQGNTESLNSLLLFLRDWFLNHILECDMKYVPYVTRGKKNSF